MNLRNRHKIKKKQTTATTGGVKEGNGEKGWISTSRFTERSSSEAFWPKETTRITEKSNALIYISGIVSFSLAPKLAERSLGSLLTSWAVTEKALRINGESSEDSAVFFFNVFSEGSNRKNPHNERIVEELEKQTALIQPDGAI